MELKDTVEMMLSDDYEERFKAEYNQLVIRQRKLSRTLLQLAKGELPFKPSCPEKMLQLQLSFMESYRNVLEARAEIEGIDL